MTGAWPHRQLILAICALAVAISLAPPAHRTRAAVPTFNRDIAPIIYAQCAACHHPGGSGPFSLIDYREARKRASQIASVTASRYMPPWLPEPGSGDFAGARRLSDEQINLIRAWAEGGAPEGAPEDRMPAPAFKAGWQLGAPDLILTMDQTYVLPASGSDVFRNFVIRVPISSTRHVRAIEILPGNQRIVHHANILIDRTGAARRRDAMDPGAGFEGMDVTIASERFEPESHFLFWKPGTVPWVEPDGLAWELQPGTDLVLNMHLQPAGKPEAIRPSIGLYFTAHPPTRFPMLLQLEHDGALDIPPGRRDFTIVDELRLPVAVEVLGVYPHAHYLGREIEGYAMLPDGTRRSLIRIRDWDLNWQAVYRYERPLRLPRGTVLGMRYRYDNSAENPRQPSRPPRRVRGGNRSIDEMGHLWLQVLPQPDESGMDPRLLLQRALMEARLRKYPGDYTAHYNLGSALAQEGRHEAAVEHYRAALRAQPADAMTLNSLGASLQEQGQLDQAEAHYRKAIARAPELVDAHYNLGNLLLVRGRLDEALIHLRETARRRPDDAGAQNSLGSALAMRGETKAAISHFERAIAIDPAYADAHSNLAALLAEAGRAEEAIAHYREAVRLRPEDADAHNELGALLGARGAREEAISHFERALAIDPAHAAARENLRRARAK